MIEWSNLGWSHLKSIVAIRAIGNCSLSPTNCDHEGSGQLRAIEVVRKVSSANHRVPARNQYQLLVAWKKYIGCPSVMKVVSLIIKNMIIELICVSYWKKNIHII